MTKLEQLLLDALKKASAHLEYCGYGDQWERECASEAKLEQTIEDAINAGEAQLSQER